MSRVYHVQPYVLRSAVQQALQRSTFNSSSDQHMPPLPRTLEDDTLEIVLSLQRRQKDLVEFQIPRLRACVGPLSLQQDLATELREDVESFARQLEALDILVDDQKGEQNRKELRQTVQGFRDTLASLRQDIRAALLASKRAIDSQSRSQREELLASYALKEKQNSNENATDDALMKASGDVTDALRRTIDLMQGELERSVLTSQMLDASTTTLRSTSSTHDTLTNVMTTSKQLITALEKSDWLDRLLILSGLAFFVLVVLFILKQRIIDRGVRVALWWTRFLPISSWSAAKAVVSADGTSMSSLSVTTSAVVTSASTLLPSLTAAWTRPSSGTKKPPAMDDSTLLPTLDMIASTSEHLIELPSSISTYSSIISTDTDASDPRTSDVDVHDEL